MKFKKKLIATLVAAAISQIAVAQNIGFEDGTATGWTGNGVTAVGTQTLQAGQNQWTVNPYGNYMGKLTIQSGTFSQMATALDLTTSSTSGIQSTLTTQAQSTGNGQGNPTTASWASKTVTLTAGQQFTLAWQYISTDYVPFNDGSIATLVKVGDPTVSAVLNNYTSQYALLGFTNPGTGDYSTGSYGSTGWQTATYNVTSSGDYLLGFGVFNLDDTALSPVLYVDEVTGTTLLNGQTFGAVAPNPGTSAPDTSGGGSVTPPPPPPPTGPTLVSNVTGTTGTDTLAAGNITVNGGTIQIMMTGSTLTQLFDVQSGAMTIDQNSNTATVDGVISGTGDVVIANSGTDGSITFTAVNTYTGATTINQGATLINNGSIASSSGTTNLGTFTNNGTAGALVNGFNGDGNTAVTNNNGTVGTVTNWSTFNNNTGATTGTVTNFGTFENAGATGTFNNAGVLNNNIGGIVNELGYNNHIVNNSGTINTITYNGGTVNNNTGGVIGTINTTEAHGTFHNDGTVTGAINTNGTFNNNSGGVVQGLFTNSGTLTNNGTLANVVNNNTFTNNSTAGNVINSGTFDNAGTAGSISSNGILNNSGNAGAVTLVGGTFTNAGTAASVDNTGALTFTNSGTITGLLTNAGTVTNEGNVGSVNNTGTYSNAGTTGDWTNSNVMSNTGNMGNGTNTGTFTNDGTTGSISNSGTTTNNGTTGTVTNTGWFTNALNAITGFVTNGLNFTNNGTTGGIDNSGTFTNNGTTGDWTNSNTIANAGTMGNGTNSGTYSNTGTVGDVTNTGTLTTSGTGGAITNSGSVTMTGGSLSGINNTGTFTVSGGTLGSYTQTSPGTTVMFAGTPFVVTGAAALGGGLAISNSQTAYGKYPVLSAGSVDGTFDTFTSAGVNDYLKYSGNDVKLYVTPSAGLTQTSIGNTVGNISSMNSLQSGVINNSLGNDCGTFGDSGMCMSVNLANTAASSGDLVTGGLTVAKRINDNWKAGVFVSNPFNDPTIGGVSQKNNPAVGGFVGWNQNADGTGFGVQGSVASNSGKMTVTRSGPETGTGTATTNGQAVQLKGTYSHRITDKTTLTDYIGVRQTKLNVGGYTETGAVFPLTVNGTQQTTTDLIAGIGGSHKFTDKLSANASVGIVQNISNSGGNFSGTSEIGNLQTFNTALPASKYTSASVGAGLSYEVGKNQRVGVSVGWQQKGLSNADITSYGLNYTAGF